MSAADGTDPAEPEDFRPTHVAPIEGLATWMRPDFSEPSVRLDPLLPLLAVDVRGDWTRVVCSNGWTAWVDGRLLVSLPHSPPGATQALARSADPRPLLRRLEQALAHYREQVEDVTEGTIDLETFRRLTRGLRLGLVLDGDAAWLLDEEQSRWVYYDGLQLHTYATVEPPDTGAHPVTGAQGPPTWVPGDA
ncbi:hypothetical protein [Streptacidiphilus jiangxiensis]|uniref:Uncharacterized protein n=1 Tax=Streptacidiphilus jiangxiensis TaxID=235985 RepID=A0A1H7ZDC3_STRJI|nr:hypothetical protein [Streptacidiphilus jiangxiensis]SEM56231.1 hypothetical protein SAMN05414137_13439 [Streptacidiphilus jiangxiensis]